MSLISSSFDYTVPLEVIEYNYTPEQVEVPTVAKTGFDIAKDYNIDYKLIKAIAVIESGWKHNSHMARTKNNIFGLMGKSFKSVDECIHYWCKLYNKRYKGMSIDEMAKIYCPPNSEKWAEKVKEIMRRLE
jgi:hypothetical protein